MVWRETLPSSRVIVSTVGSGRASHKVASQTTRMDDDSQKPAPPTYMMTAAHSATTMLGRGSDKPFIV